MLKSSSLSPLKHMLDSGTGATWTDSNYLDSAMDFNSAEKMQHQLEFLR